MTTESQSLLQVGVFQRRSLPLHHIELPAAGIVHLWFLDLKHLGSPIHQADEAEPFELTPRQERTIRRFYLRLLLGAYLQLPGKEVSVSRQLRGKPVLDVDAHQQMLDFSIAGSDGCALVGVSTGGLVGVDLELEGRRTGNPAALARRYFSSEEASAINALDRAQADRAFLYTWACKEAVVKAAGHGIANQLCRFSVNTDPDAPPELLDMRDDDPAAWSLAVCTPSDRHLGAVAVRHRGLKVEGFTLQHRS